jgi:hypothetical protein
MDPTPPVVSLYKKFDNIYLYKIPATQFHKMPIQRVVDWANINRVCFYRVAVA